MITVLPENLHKAVKSVKITEFNKTLPVLNYALLFENDGYLWIATIDFENHASVAKCAARVESGFAVCVPMTLKTETHPTGSRRYTSIRTFHPFPDFCKVLSQCCNEAVNLSLDPKTMTLSIDFGRSHTEFKCIGPQEFPAIPSTLCA